MDMTLVRHSAWVVSKDPRFENAVETAVLSPRQAARVRGAGGLVMTSKEAYEREYAENYPPEVKGMIPRVKGTLSKTKLCGAQIYIPEAKP